MAIDTTLQYADLDQLFLDPMNPRLGRRNVEEELSEPAVLELMQDWGLEELAISFLSNAGNGG